MNKVITKEELAEIPLQAFEGRITVLDFPREVRNVAQFLKKYPVLGFDTETRPNFKKGQKHQVALLQRRSIPDHKEILGQSDFHHRE